jgi:prepilin-type N-terminal cleavage/methylation domain-containing protein
MNRRSDHRRGFTLVELLAVIMIIALLAALVTPAVMRSLSSAKAAAVKVEIDLLSTALMNYKNEYGSFPPCDMRGLWNPVTDQVVQSHPAYKHLQRIFPRINEVTTDVANNGQASPYFWMAQMSPAQALVFWLQGYFDNPQFPLTNGQALFANMPRAGTASANRNKLFDFDETRLYAATAYWPLSAPFTPTNQTFSNRNAATTTPFSREYPVYFPNQANTGLPYVYFPSSSYSASPDLSYVATSLSGNNSAVSPYFNSGNCSIMNPLAPQFSWAQLHMNAETFQLVAGGADGTYGNATAGFPGDASFTIGATSFGPFLSVSANTGHEDNITNFATGRLREAAEKLSQ